jgi:flagellar basal-body rod modification protein FlgD
MTSVTTNNAYLDSLAAGAGSTATTKKSGDMDQNDFLRLMITQLQTQDPFNPVENTEMVAQMAQFSSVSGIAEMNASLKGISASLSTSRISDAASWVGKSALVQSDIAVPGADGAYSGEILLPEDANSVSYNLVDENGAVVHTETLGGLQSGSTAFRWDGGGRTGPLKVVVTASNDKGFFDTATLTWARISAVQSPAGATQKLVTPLGLVDPADTVRLG